MWLIYVYYMDNMVNVWLLSGYYMEIKCLFYGQYIVNIWLLYG